MKIKLYKLNLKRIFAGILSLMFIAFSFFGCNEETTPSLWDSRPPDGTKPEITGFNPPTESLAGVDIVEIIGTGFSSVVEENVVYFGTAKATVLAASPTKLTVRVPNNPKDTLFVKCYLTNSTLFSEPKQYRLRVAAGDVLTLANRSANAVTMDNAGNYYIHAFNVKPYSEVGFIKIAPDGTETLFAPPGSTTSSVIFTSIKFGPANNIFCIRNATKAIFEVKEGVAAKAWATGFTNNLTDFDFDNKGFVWTGGVAANGKLYRITYNNPKRVVNFPFQGDVKSIRYFDNALYVAATRDNAEKIYKIPIVSDSLLGTEEEYFNVTAAYPNVKLSTITFSQDGVLFAGNADTLATSPPIIMIAPDKSSSIFFDVLLGDPIYSCPVLAMYWGNSDDLYFVRGKTSAHGQEVVRVIVTNKRSAPYYNRG